MTSYILIFSCVTDVQWELTKSFLVPLSHHPCTLFRLHCCTNFPFRLTPPESSRKMIRMLRSHLNFNKVLFSDFFYRLEHSLSWREVVFHPWFLVASSVCFDRISNQGILYKGIQKHTLLHVTFLPLWSSSGRLNSTRLSWLFDLFCSINQGTSPS